jgi:hypothetical protein
VDTSAVSGLFGLLEKPSGSASASPIDDLREQMAYREEIRDEIFRNALDDRHDLNGNTVYRLTFSATVLPENDTSAWAVIHMTLVPPKDPGDTDVLFDTWVQNIYKTMRLELDRRLWDASEDDRLLALKSLYAGTHDLLPDDSLEMRRAIETEILTGRPWEAPVTPTAVIAREIYVSAVLEDLIDEFGLRDFVTLQRPAGGGKVFWLSPRDGGKDKFAGIVRGDHEYFSYAVTPRESVQRITDTITSREYSELGLAFSGLLGSAGTKALLDRIKVSELAAATIKRQPLVVGFGGLPGSAVDGGTFGWVLGPRITTASDGKKVLYRHAAAGYSLAALVSVPATWNSVELRIDCCWVTEAGDTLSERKSTMKVGLPGDMQELTFSVTGHRRLGPLPLVKDEYDAQGEGSVTLLVEGENLWRNPVVTMGTQVADKVELLPNMRGLIVEFKNVPWFTKKNETEQTRDIRVWTSEGAAFAGLVRVHAPVKKAVVKPTKEQSKDAK